MEGNIIRNFNWMNNSEKGLKRMQIFLRRNVKLDKE